MTMKNDSTETLPLILGAYAGKVLKVANQRLDFGDPFGETTVFAGVIETVKNQQIDLSYSCSNWTKISFVPSIKKKLYKYEASPGGRVFHFTLKFVFM